MEKYNNKTFKFHNLGFRKELHDKNKKADDYLLIDRRIEADESDYVITDGIMTRVVSELTVEDATSVLAYDGGCHTLSAPHLSFLIWAFTSQRIIPNEAEERKRCFAISGGDSDNSLSYTATSHVWNDTSRRLPAIPIEVYYACSAIQRLFLIDES
ncbi:hypothetical protein V2J09_001479 [Rumex salicifolius]